MTVLAEAGCTVPEIASFTGHSLKHVASILEKYLPMTKGQALSAAHKLANHLRTKYPGNRLQTVVDSATPTEEEKARNILKTLERAKGIEPSSLSLGS